MNFPSNPVMGQTFYDITTTKVWMWLGSNWVELTSGIGKIQITPNIITTDNSLPAMQGTRPLLMWTDEAQEIPPSQSEIDEALESIRRASDERQDR